MPEQYCPRCETTKELSAENFYRNKSRASGLDSQMCKLCRRAYTRARYERIIREPLVKDKVQEEEIPVFGSFEDKALREKYQVLRAGVTSIHKSIGVASPLEGDN